MAKRKVEEPHVKARRTSLEKKSVEELIKIILRKESTERKNNDKISYLNERCATLEKMTDVKVCQDALNQIDDLTTKLIDVSSDRDKMLKDYANLIESLKTLKADYDRDVIGFNKEIIRLTNKSNVLQKSFWITLSLSIVTIVLLLLL